jgi:hypothetical protein
MNMKAAAIYQLPAVETKDVPLSPINFWQTLSAISFVMGTFLCVLGLLLSLLSAILILSKTPLVGRTEAGLLVIGLVLLITGSHCEDRINEIRTAVARADA